MWPQMNIQVSSLPDPKLSVAFFLKDYFPVVQRDANYIAFGFLLPWDMQLIEGALVGNY